MYDVLTVSQYIAWQSWGRGIEQLTNLRLQKILYFLQLVFLSDLHTPCFMDITEAWDLGPVVPKVYRHYEKYGYGVLPGERTLEMEVISPKHRKVINEILDKLDEYSTYQLIAISKEQMPWKKNYVNYETHEIPLEDLKAFAPENSKEKQTKPAK